MLPMLDKDKANHFVYGAVIAAVPSLVLPWWVGAVACLAAAIVKELMDLTDDNENTHYDPMDGVATVAGGVVVLAPLVLPTLVM